MTDYKLKDDLLKIAFGDVNTPAEGAHLKVFKRDGSGDVLANAVSDASGDFPTSQWPDYSGDVVACYYYDEQGGTKHPPRAIVASPVEAPYVEPLFTINTSSEAATTWNPPLNELRVAGTNTGFSGNGDIVSNETTIKNTEVYLLKYDFTALVGGLKDSSFGVTNTSSIGAGDVVEFSCRLGQIIAGNGEAFTPDVGQLLAGFIFIDMGNQTFSVFDSSDNSLHVELVGFNTFVPASDMSLFFQLSGIKSPEINEATLTFNKNEFGDISSGDLGVRLAANPNWKQIGE